MNLNRLRPTGVKREDLDLWLSGVINDAIRDASEAGLDATAIFHLLKTFTETNHPHGYKYRSRDMAATKPATLFDVRSNDNASKGTLMIADFNDPNGPPDPVYMATLAPPPFVVPPGTRTQSAAVRALQKQVQAVYDQLAEIAATLERQGR